MTIRISLAKTILVAVVTGAAATSAAAEFQCAPAGVATVYPLADPVFVTEMDAWSKVTRSRYLEGSGKSCTDVTVPGYEGYPTKRCTYSSVDDGAKAFHPLNAQVILLDPSAQQLASWSIHACRLMGAKDSAMVKCLGHLRTEIIKSNGAQFPVVGSVVESTCNSSGKFPDGCSALPDNDKARQPRNTWFRDGVSVDYKESTGIKWDEKAYPVATFDTLFDVENSDKLINHTFVKARIAGAIRSQWSNWRKYMGKPLMPSGVTETSIDGAGWQSVSREVQKAACKSDANELFDAVVYSNSHQ